MSLLRTAVYSLVVPVPITALVPWWLLRVDEPWLWSDAPWRWIGLVPIALGVIGYLWCAWTFATAGRGTPNPADPPRRLVIEGPYRFVRNPMYVACMAILVGEVALTGAPWLIRYLAGSLLVVELLVRGLEEPRMRRRFGEEYERYCRQVGRWMPRPARS